MVLSSQCRTYLHRLWIYHLYSPYLLGARTLIEINWNILRHSDPNM